MLDRVIRFAGLQPSACQARMPRRRNSARVRKARCNSAIAAGGSSLGLQILLPAPSLQRGSAVPNPADRQRRSRGPGIGQRHAVLFDLQHRMGIALRDGAIEGFPVAHADAVERRLEQKIGLLAHLRRCRSLPTVPARIRMEMIEGEPRMRCPMSEKIERSP